MEQRLNRVMEILNGPMIGPADTPKVDDKCRLCKEAHTIGRQAYYYITQRIMTSYAMQGNCDMKVRHRDVVVYPGRGINIGRMNYRAAYESEIDIYSHNYHCYTFMVAVRSIYTTRPHRAICPYKIVEIDIPYRKQAPVPVDRASYKIAYGLADYLSEVNDQGTTTLDHWENDRAGRYKITVAYFLHRALNAIPLEEGYTRIGQADNNLINAPETLVQAQPQSAAPIMINVATQTSGGHMTPGLLEGDRRRERRSRRRTYLETVLEETPQEEL